MRSHPVSRTTVLATAVVVLDLSSKAIASDLPATARGGVISPLRNAGYSLGLVQGPRQWLALGAFAVILAAGWWSRRSRLVTTWWVGPLVLGGAVANLVDRAATGAVHDFIATPWIVFNVADVAVLIGIVRFYCDRFLPTPSKGGEHHDQPPPEADDCGDPRRSGDLRRRHHGAPGPPVTPASRPRPVLRNTGGPVAPDGSDVNGRGSS